MKLYDIIKNILEEKVSCRNSDKHLIWTYMTYKAHKAGSPTVDLRDFLNCTPFESITRNRRAVQKHHPELRASKTVQEARTQKQDAFSDWIYR